MTNTAFPNGVTIGSTVIATGATIAVGTEATDVINVDIDLTDADGNNVTAITAVHAYLSDAATGSGVSGTAPSGGVAEGTNGKLAETVANKVFILLSDATGNVDIDLTDTGTPTFYLVVVLPTGKVVVSDAITFA